MSVIASTLSERKTILTAFGQWRCIRATVSTVKRSLLMLQDYRLQQLKNVSVPKRHCKSNSKLEINCYQHLCKEQHIYSINAKWNIGSLGCMHGVSISGRYDGLLMVGWYEIQRMSKLFFVETWQWKSNSSAVKHRRFM